MRIIESCPRCGSDCERTMPSSLEDGNHICIPCAEEELLRPSRARKKISKLKQAGVHGVNRNQTVKLWFSEEYKGKEPPARELHQPQGLYLPIHLGHAVKKNMAVCCYQRFSMERITSNPNKVTCLRCLTHIRKQNGRENST